jgi:hypothetical protein
MEYCTVYFFLGWPNKMSKAHQQQKVASIRSQHTNNHTTYVDSGEGATYNSSWLNTLMHTAGAIIIYVWT